MIYSYTYIEHPIQKFNEGIMFFFRKLIDLDLPVYDDTQLLKACFKPLVDKSSVALLEKMKEITSAFHALSDDEKLQVRKAFDNNQDIENICAGDGYPQKYDDIQNEEFRALLKKFFDDIWNRISNKDDGVNEKVKAKCGTIMDHFQKFREHANHKTRICPFCGLNGFKPSFSPTRNAYDHYLPKAQYPFLSVNFKNLVPMCHDCNSDEKGTADVPFSTTGRREVYYPYDNGLTDTHFEAKVMANEDYNTIESSTLLKDIDWDYVLTSDGTDDDRRLVAWNDIFRLNERYKEILRDYETLWYEHLTKEYQKFKANGKTFAEIKVELLGDLKKEFIRTERSAVHYSYLKFILNTEGIEESLNQTS
jgi:hypothetical protein